MIKLRIMAAGLSVGFVLATGCHKKAEPAQGPAESAGEEIDQAGEAAGDKVEEAGDKVEDAADDAAN
jgi:hypothetical protein